MGRPTTWKSISLTSQDDYNRLMGSYGSSKGIWTEYTFNFAHGLCDIETNMPWSELRAWFRFSDVRLPDDILIDDKPLSEAVLEWEKE